jgi:hypothetical protein
MVTGIETLAVGYLIAWAVRKARRVGERADAEVDRMLDVGMNQLHELVSAKLGEDPSLFQLEAEAGDDEDNPRTRERVRLAIEDAVENDHDFKAELERLVMKLTGIVPAVRVDASAEVLTVRGYLGAVEATSALQNADIRARLRAETVEPDGRAVTVRLGESGG